MERDRCVKGPYDVVTTAGGDGSEWLKLSFQAPNYREGSQGLFCHKIAQFFPLTWSYVQLRENWARSLICSSLNIRWVMAGGKKDISFPPHLTAQKPAAKFKSWKQLLGDLQWQDPKRKGQTVRKQNICLDTIQRCFLPPTLFPFSNLGLGFPCNYKGCAT